jgi:hypothetical protein
MSANPTSAVAPFTIYPSWFGDRLHFNMPAGCDVILVCADTVQHTPALILLPHQLTLEKARELMNKHGTDSLTVMPYRNADKIKISRAALASPAPKGET